MLIYFFIMRFGHMESLTYICGMIKDKILKFIYKDLHPLNEAAVRLTKNKWYDFAKGKTSCASGKFKLVRMRKSSEGETIVDVEIRLIQDERCSKDKLNEIRNRTINYYIPKSDLINMLILVGIKEYKLGNIKIK